MSAIAIPKECFDRPPGGPPTRTCFDGLPSDDGESFSKWLASNVSRLIESVREIAADKPDVAIALLEQRRSWIISYLDTMRTYQPMDLPPFPNFPLDYLITKPDDPEGQLVGLLNALDGAIYEIRSFLTNQSELRSRLNYDG